MAQDIEDKKHLFLNHSFPLPFPNMSSALAKLPLHMKRYPTVEDIPLGNQRMEPGNSSYSFLMYLLFGGHGEGIRWLKWWRVIVFMGEKFMGKYIYMEVI
ncbi:hypothetical protein L3X38_034163 [Prunus dulcis]|uniref:Uncharacterized protein n=1 Tax=Prunus dulcis TaxID=3755 RepID=A0AAD4YXK8_PRUDU|nr:hypothetical protein L3X38_034163 [Prunus dulcis]